MSHTSEIRVKIVNMNSELAKTAIRVVAEALKTEFEQESNNMCRLGNCHITIRGDNIIITGNYYTARLLESKIRDAYTAITALYALSSMGYTAQLNYDEKTGTFEIVAEEVVQ